MSSTIVQHARHSPLASIHNSLAAIQTIGQHHGLLKENNQQDETVNLSSTPRRHCVKVTMMRAGTSKGIFIMANQLPTDKERWKSILPFMMGSPDKFGRQIDGLGGGTSTTSKLAIIAKSKTPELAQIDYEFVQASTTLETLDFSGNCGNILSGVGPYAYEENILSNLPQNGSVSLKIRCLNNGQIFRSTFEVQNGFPVEYGSMKVDGVSATGSPIKLDFLRPAGSMTGSLLPTGKPINHLPVYGFDHPIEVSCVDAANPFCFITLEDVLFPNESVHSVKMIDLTDRVERIRQAASLAMGITSSIQSAATKRGTPKICIVSKCDENENGHISTQSWSMGNPHPALQLTGAACIAVAIHTPGTILNKIVCRSQIEGKIPLGPLRICHPAGAIEAKADVEVHSNGQIDVHSATLYRTARRLFKGEAYYVA